MCQRCKRACRWCWCWWEAGWPESSAQKNVRTPEAPESCRRTPEPGRTQERRPPRCDLLGSGHRRCALCWGCCAAGGSPWQWVERQSKGVWRYPLREVVKLNSLEALVGNTSTRCLQMLKYSRGVGRMGGGDLSFSHTLWIWVVWVAASLFLQMKTLNTVKEELKLNKEILRWARFPLFW